MAMKIVAASAGLLAGVSAFSATPASAEPAQGASLSQPPPSAEAIGLHGLSRMSCAPVSRGPLAPPDQRLYDYMTLLGEVPL